MAVGEFYCKLRVFVQRFLYMYCPPKALELQANLPSMQSGNLLLTVTSGKK